jgi:hypothetical protein
MLGSVKDVIRDSIGANEPCEESPSFILMAKKGLRDR